MDLFHPFPAPPAFGEITTVAPGIRWMRVPLPIALGHINVWLMEEKDGLSLIDTGFGDDGARAVWDQAFSGPLSGRKLTRLLVTHYHPDHAGLAAHFSRRFGLVVEMTLKEWAYGRLFATSWGEEEESNAADFYRELGAEGALMALALGRHRSYQYEVDGFPARFRRLEDGAALTFGGAEWRIATAGGHSPEMACLIGRDNRILIAGDQILPSINTSMIMTPFEQDANPLEQYFASLERFRLLPEDTLVLPSHGLPFYGLRSRIDQLRFHHQERLERTLDSLSIPSRASDILDRLFRRRLDGRQRFFALIETLAHLNYLVGKGEVSREKNADGAWLHRRG